MSFTTSAGIFPSFILFIYYYLIYNIWDAIAVVQENPPAVKAMVAAVRVDVTE